MMRAVSFGVIILLLLTMLGGCNGCSHDSDIEEEQEMTDIAPLTAAENMSAMADTESEKIDNPNAIAYVTYCSGECRSGAGDDGERLLPGTKLVGRALLQSKEGYTDILFPEIGVVRLQSHTIVELAWEDKVPVLHVRQGEIGAVIRGGRQEAMRVVTSRLLVPLRFEVGMIIRSIMTGDELAVGWGDAKVVIDGQSTFIEAGEFLLVTGEAGETLIPADQPPVWRQAIELLTSIIHADEFVAAKPEPIEAAAAVYTPPPATRGAIRVSRISSLGVPLNGSCRIYEQQQEVDVYGTSFAFPQDMPVNLLPGTYAVKLVYTDIIYPLLGNIEVVAGATSDAEFSGFGRLQLERHTEETTLPLFFRIFTGKEHQEITRHSLELTANGIELELLPGQYDIEFVYIDNDLVPPQKIEINEGETTIKKISF